jgi:hypothetical protein
MLLPDARFAAVSFGGGGPTITHQVLPSQVLFIEVLFIASSSSAAGVETADKAHEFAADLALPDETFTIERFDYTCER